MTDKRWSQTIGKNRSMKPVHKREDTGPAVVVDVVIHAVKTRKSR